MEKRQQIRNWGRNEKHLPAQTIDDDNVNDTEAEAEAENCNDNQSANDEN